MAAVPGARRARGRPFVNTKVLFVDDDDNILAAAHRNYRKRYQLDTAYVCIQAHDNVTTWDNLVINVAVDGKSASINNMVKWSPD